MLHSTSSRGFLGFHRATAAFVVVQVFLLAISVTGFLQLGLDFDWRELLTGQIWVIGLFWVMWALHARTPARDRREWVVSETFLVIALLLTFSLIGSPLQYVILEIVDTAPVMKTATKTASNKPAKLENGVTINVPEFISSGERVRVNPTTGEYMERAKEER